MSPGNFVSKFQALLGFFLIDPHQIVALNTPQLNALGGYVNGVPSTCFQSITISYNGVTQVATIEDGRCFSSLVGRDAGTRAVDDQCPNTDLDLQNVQPAHGEVLICPRVSLPRSHPSTKESSR
jgi:hypothetical protein